MPEREQMSGVDTAWLRMDRPGNPMVIAGVMIFADPLDIGRVRETIRARFLCFPRFRQRPVEEMSGTRWETDPEFDLERHVRRVGLPGAGGKTDLEELVSDLVSSPLDPARPRWQFDLVERYRGGSALVARIHHCYADGIALMRVLLSLTDPSPVAAVPAAAAEVPDEDANDPWSRLFAPVTETVAGALRLGGVLWQDYIELVTHPMRAVEYAGRGLDIAAEASRLALMSSDSPTRLKGSLTGVKRVAWAEPMALPDIKEVGLSLGCSINDVLVAAVVGALRSHLETQGDRVEGIEVRAIVPVNLRPAGHDDALGNHFGLVFLDLPLGIANPLARLYEVSRRMRELRHSSQPVLVLGLLGAVGMGPKLIEEQVLDVLSRNASMVITNVPGPREPLYLAGARLAEHVFWVPQAGNIGIGISILSYAERVHFGVIADKHLVADPHAVVDRIPLEFDTLLLAALMHPWGERPDPEAAEARIREWLSDRAYA